MSKQGSRGKGLQPAVSAAERPEGLKGLVINHHGQSFAVEDSTGVVHRCTARRKIGGLVCGDEVIWQPGVNGEGVILALQPRRTVLMRPDHAGAVKPIAANVEQMLILTAPHMDSGLLDGGLIDRYLVAAELAGLQAAVVINKSDLFTPETRGEAERVTAVYQAIGYETLYTSAKRGLGMGALIEVLRDHISILVGPSGAGKSSLVKALLPEREIRVGAVSKAGSGRHTTTMAMLYHLPGGGRLIDSPGVRDFRLWQTEPAELARGFVEFRHHAPSCRFADCLHLAEPGCAVIQAAEQGQIAAARYRSYRRLMEARED